MSVGRVTLPTGNNVVISDCYNVTLNESVMLLYVFSKYFDRSRINSSIKIEHTLYFHVTLLCLDLYASI